MPKQIVSLSVSLGFLLALLSLPYFFFLYEKHISDEVKNYLLIYDIILPDALLAVFFYLSYYIIIPRFYLTHRYFIYTNIKLTGLFLLMACIAGSRYLYPSIARALPPMSARIISVTFRYLAVAFLSFGLRINASWKEAEEDKLKAQLAFLKAQINPHFLFNTINGIYSMAVRKADNTPDALLKLSSIMRHVFTETHQDFISLDKELNYISNYIDLQKLRLTANVVVNYVLAVADMDKQVAPLIFIPFIENAFKHGVSTEEPCNITIVIQDKTGDLELLVVNKKINTQFLQSESYGLGIGNTKQRLQHLYPHRHQLSIADEDKKYTVSLKLQLE